MSCENMSCSSNDIQDNYQSEEEERECGFIKYEDLPQWCQDPKFNRYWRHYDMVNDWYLQNHAYFPSFINNTTTNESTYRQQSPTDSNNSDSYREYALANSYYSSFLMHYHYINMVHHQQNYMSLLQHSIKAKNYRQMPPPANTSVPHSLVQSTSFARRKKNKNRKRSDSRESHKRRRKHVERVERSQESCGVGDLIFDVDASVLNQEDEIIECHMEITDEMLEFFAQSAKHREERDAQKSEEVENAKEEYIDISRVNTGVVRATTEAPKEQPGIKRTNEMKILYGKGAPMIHGMETALQLTYDRSLDLKQPKLWPHLPLNIKFD